MKRKGQKRHLSFIIPCLSTYLWPFHATRAGYSSFFSSSLRMKRKRNLSGKIAFSTYVARKHDDCGRKRRKIEGVTRPFGSFLSLRQNERNRRKGVGLTFFSYYRLTCQIRAMFDLTSLSVAFALPLVLM